MKKRIMRRLMDEMFPSKVERALAQIKTTIAGKTCITETGVIKNAYQGFPYSISRKIFRHTSPDLISFESSLEGITLPVYRNGNVNNLVHNLTNYLIFSACSIGISNPSSPSITVSIDSNPTAEPEPFDVFYYPRNKQQSPIIRGKDEEGVTELVEKTEKIYDFLIKNKKGFENALRIINNEYPYRIEEWTPLMDFIADECELEFIRLQRRPRISLTTLQRMNEIMQGAYG